MYDFTTSGRLCSTTHYIIYLYLVDSAPSADPSDKYQLRLFAPSDERTKRPPPDETPAPSDERGRGVPKKHLKNQLVRLTCRRGGDSDSGGKLGGFLLRLTWGGNSW